MTFAGRVAVLCLVTAAELVVPQYLRQLPDRDGWRQPLDLRLDRSSHRFQVRSPVQDGRFESDRYEVGPFDRAEPERDVVWADGDLGRWPEDLGR